MFKKLLLIPLIFFLFSLFANFVNVQPSYARELDCQFNPYLAPQFLRFEPQNAQIGQSVKMIFSPPREIPDSKYQIKYWVAPALGKSIEIKNQGTSDWTVDIGTFKEGIHQIKWQISDKISNPTFQMCGAADLFVCNGTNCPTYPSATRGQNPCTGGKCETALGNIPTDPQGFATKILTIGTGLGGAFAFILMVIGSIRVLTSSGDQKGVAAGRDMIVAAVSGLLFLILSTVILRFIGINILGL